MAGPAPAGPCRWHLASAGFPHQRGVSQNSFPPAFASRPQIASGNPCGRPLEVFLRPCPNLARRPPAAPVGGEPPAGARPPRPPALRPPFLICKLLPNKYLYNCQTQALPFPCLVQVRPHPQAPASQNLQKRPIFILINPI